MYYYQSSHCEFVLHSDLEDMTMYLVLSALALNVVISVASYNVVPRRNMIFSTLVFFSKI